MLGVRIDDFSESRVLDMVRAWMSKGDAKIIVTPNAEFLLKARKDRGFLDRLLSADLSVADSVSIRYAVAALTNGRLLNRITGVDLVQQIAKVCKQEGKKLLLLGGDAGSAKQSAENLRTKYPGLSVITFDPGIIRFGGDKLTILDAVEKLINSEQPNVIAVALGQGKQEAFMEAVKNNGYNVDVMIGIGGAFEMISGQKLRSPNWMRKLGLEWLWRVILEPSRARRIINASIIFPFIVVTESIKQKRFLKACKNVFPEVFRQLRGL